MSHSHSHGHHHHHEEKKSIKKDLLQIAISLIVLLVSPFIVGFISRDNIATIRSFNPDAQASQIQYDRGRIVEMVEVPSEFSIAGDEGSDFFKQYDVTVSLNGSFDGRKEITIPYQIDTRIPTIDFNQGDEVIITRQENFTGEPNYYLVDHYRLPQITVIAIIFALVVIILTGFRGISALLGLGFSLVVIIGYLIPQILTQENILLTTFITGLSILGVAIYLAHGFSKRSTVALVGSVLTICLSTLFAILSVSFSKLTGLSSEDAFQIQFSGVQTNFNFTGLLLAGIVIGTLGVLDDICTSQAATIQEISKANPKLTSRQLFQKGMNVGQEHIISLVNTIALAYVSVALPLLLLFAIYDNNPIWVTLNREVISEELIRTIVGSMSLLLAVPITSVLAARYLKVKEVKVKEEKPSF